MTDKERIGKLGEDLAVKFLKKHGYQILERNFKQLPWGEIDIIAKKSLYFYFFEVKTVTKTTLLYLPESRIDKRKRRALTRIIQVYLSKLHLPLDSLWQVDVITIVIDFNKKKYTLKHLENVFI